MNDNPVIITQRDVVVIPSSAGALSQGPAGPPGSGSTIGVKDEGGLISATVERLNFKGRDVTVTGSGADVDVTIAGGGDSIAFDSTFGAALNGSTNDSPAFGTFSGYRLTLAVPGYGYGSGIPKGRLLPAVTYQASAIDLHGSGILEGDGGSIAAGGSSVLLYPANTTGIRVQFIHSTGESGYDGASTALSATGSILRQFMLKSVNTVSNASFPAIRVRAPCAIEDVFIDAFAGDGITANCQLSVAGTNYGNASSSQVWRCTIQNCLNGVKFEGPDASIFTVLGTYSNSNRGYGFVDNSLLGGLWIGCHGAVNALGNWHTVDSADTAGAYPTIIHGYNESGSPACTFSPRTLRVGGSWNGDETGGGHVWAFGNRVRVNALYSEGNASIAGDFLDFGPHTGTADFVLNLMSMGVQNEIIFWRNDFAIQDGYILNISGTTYFNSTNSVHLRAGGNDIATVGSGGVDLAAGKVLSIAGTTVLNGQMTHTADLTAPPTAADFNALLAKLQAIGLMA